MFEQVWFFDNVWSCLAGIVLFFVAFYLLGLLAKGARAVLIWRERRKIGWYTRKRKERN
jgi:hypothetical protein